MLHAPVSDIATIGILFAVRNIAVIMVIGITLLHRVENAAFATIYFPTEVPIPLGAVAVFPRW
jgi:hypothetical protein